MTVVTVKVEGLEGLLADFARLQGEVRGRALQAAGMAGALPIERGAKGKAPALTRTLARSIHSEVLEVDTNSILMGIGTDVEYAAMQEFGGTATPTQHQFMAIPLTAAARAQANALNFPGLKPRISAGGQSGALVDGQGVAQYALVRSVTIPAQPFLRPALDEGRDEAAREVGEVLRGQIRKAVGG